MPFQLSEDVKAQLPAIIQKMEQERLDVCAIPNGFGAVVVRVDSAEFRRRSGPRSGVLRIPIANPGGGFDFVVFTG